MVPFLLSIKFWPFPVGWVKLPKEIVPGKGCQNRGLEIHLMSTIHFPLSLKKNKKTEKWTFEASLICLSSNFHATQLKLLVNISKHYSRQFACKTNFNSNWMCLDNKNLHQILKFKQWIIYSIYSHKIFAKLSFLT